jgi:hypothetical protein
MSLAFRESVDSESKWKQSYVEFKEF